MEEDWDSTLSNSINLLCDVKSKIIKLLNREGIVLLNPSRFNKTIQFISKFNNTHFVFFNITDISTEFFNITPKSIELNNLLAESNNKITIITDAINLKKPTTNKIKVTSQISVISQIEFIGTYRNNIILKKPCKFAKLFSSFNRRNQIDRLYFYLELIRNNMLDDGYVSFLSENKIDSISNKKRRSIMLNRLSLIGEQYTSIGKKSLDNLPFSNFNKTYNLHDIDKNSKYSIIYETYNTQNHDNPTWMLFTEKIFRSLLVPNITLSVNTSGGNRYLTNIGFKMHELNLKIDTVDEFIDQAEALINILQNDPVLDDFNLFYDNAIHNQQKLNEYWNILNDDMFYNNLIKRITI